MKRKTFYLGLAMLLLLFAFVTLSTRSSAGGVHSFGNTTPTAIPPEALTRIALPKTATPDYSIPILPFPTQSSTMPTFDFQQKYPGFPSLLSPEQVLAQKLTGNPSGNGLLTHSDPPVILKGSEAGVYKLSDLAWTETTYDSRITVWPGYVRASPTQGILWIQISGHYESYNDRLVVQSPAPAGKLTITGAVGERLILNSEQGTIFYFDIPGLRFVDTLTENVPSAMPIPTVDSATEDAPDLPISLTYSQQVNVPLDSFITTSNDYDWFHFYSAVPGSITVSLIPRSGNYGLRVVLVDRNQMAVILQEDATAGNERKQVVISDAPSGDYVVRVWSLDGSFSESQPYTLRFDAPEPEKIAPILECVAENSDGTYTAHFGYNNPNPFVVSLSAKNHENKFEPPPIFRTGQPVVFAPGRVTDWFSVIFDGNGLTWLLDGQVVTANRNSLRCP